MFIKNKIIKCLGVIVLVPCVLYFGISSIATFIRAFSQSYMINGNIEYHFLGYYIIAGLNGVVCVAAIILLILLFMRKKSK